MQFSEDLDLFDDRTLATEAFAQYILCRISSAHTHKYITYLTTKIQTILTRLSFIPIMYHQYFMTLKFMLTHSQIAQRAGKWVYIYKTSLYTKCTQMPSL